MSSYRAANARTYALVGFSFYLIGLVGLIFGAIVLFFNFAGFSSFTGFPFFYVTIVVVFITMLAIWVGLSAWAWSTLKQIEAGKYGKARTSSLILGVIGLFFGFLLGGIFFLLAYSELGSVMFVPPSPPRFCIHCGRAVPLEAKFCPSCGRELP